MSAIIPRMPYGVKLMPHFARFLWASQCEGVCIWKVFSQSPAGAGLPNK